MKSWQEYTEDLYKKKKKNLMIWIIMMVLSLTQSQTFWSMKSSGPMLKILQTKLQYHMNRELANVQAGFRKGRGMRDQTSTFVSLTMIRPSVL